LMARLDRLAPVKEIAQVGAAIGREFPYGLVRAVVGRDDAALRLGLTQLEEAELVFRRGTAPNETYTFKHALVRDAAYESLLKSRRQVLHRRIAEALRDHFPAIAETQPEVVAHHFSQAGLTEAAAEWWSKAGERAIQRSAYNEAIAHLEKALSLAEELADGPAQRLMRLRMQITYGNALMAVRGQGASETAAAFDQAREFAARIEDAVERFSAYFGLWGSSLVRGELLPMQAMAEGLVRDAEIRPGSPEVGIAHRAFGTTCSFQGDFVGARRHLEQALSAYDAERNQALALQFAQDIGVSAMDHLAMVLWPLGELDRARQLEQRALAHAARSGHVYTIAFAHGWSSFYEAMRRDAARACEHAETVVRLCGEHGIQMWLALGTFLLGWARWHAGYREPGMTQMRHGDVLAREQRIHFTGPLRAVLLAEVEAEMGCIEDAVARIVDICAEVGQTGQRAHEAELHRVRGQLLLQHEPRDPAAAEAAFKQAIEIARRQQTRTFELRAALSLGKLYQATGRDQTARDLLVPALVGFSDGLELPEVGESLRLLASLDQISGAVV
jgi:predicted ATPase